MCPACARLNWAKRHQTGDLRGYTALVTGGRIKIGFQVALKLLRAGARVLVTSRFPKDTVGRFGRQPDFVDWGERLEVYGLDFRNIPALEAFTDYLKQHLETLGAFKLS